MMGWSWSLQGRGCTLRHRFSTAAGVAVYLIPAMASVIILAMCSCSSEDICVCPDGKVPDPTIQNIWPNDDGTYWTYSVTVNTWDPPTWGCDSLYGSAGVVPPIPTLDEVEDLLEDHDVGDSVETTGAIYEQRFAGDTTSHSGATGQNLREILYRQDESDWLANGKMWPNPFLQHLYLARPDLRCALESIAGDALAGNEGFWAEGGHSILSGCFSVECPILIHGYVWEKTDEWIGTYGDVDTLLAWKFLDADLSPGHEFIHQLIPGLADDVFLHCRVLGEASINTPAGNFEKSVECVYIIDYGIAVYTSVGGEPIGYCRTFDYGTVTYVPEVGPVHSYERLLVEVGEPVVGTGYAERFLSLVSFGIKEED